MILLAQLVFSHKIVLVKLTKKQHNVHVFGKFKCKPKTKHQKRK